MKEKILFIAAIIGSFSATIILLITQGLTLAGVDTTGYIDIINIVGVALAFIILVVGVFFLNKYNVIQQKFTADQNKVVVNSLDANATLMNNLLPKLASDILVAAQERSDKLLKTAETNLNSMMTEMLPQLAEQTMQLVTKKSQNIVNETTAKAEAVMKTMDELIPTYAHNIASEVAQTVRENNAHYHKMLNEVKSLFVDVCARPIATNIPPIINMPAIDLTSISTNLEQSINAKLDEAIAKLLEAQSRDVTATIFVPVESEPVVESEEESTTQNDETSEKSDETETT